MFWTSSENKQDCREKENIPLLRMEKKFNHEFQLIYFDKLKQFHNIRNVRQSTLNSLLQPIYWIDSW